MDDPWADPWGDSTHKTTVEQVKPTLLAWDHPSPPHEKDAAPKRLSWEHTETVSWIAAPAEAPAWDRDEHPSWTSPHSSLNGVIGTPSRHLDEDTTAAHNEGDEYDASKISVPATPVIPAEPSPLVLPLEITPPFLETDISPVLGGHPDIDTDVFGGFESGLNSAATEEVGGWSPSPDPFLEEKSGGEDVWGKSWEAQPSQSMKVEQPDEWEAARQRKEEQDKHVPPKLLEIILTQFEDLGDVLWKEEGKGEPKTNTGTTTYRSFDPQSLNLNSSQEKIVPEQLNLPLPLPFPQSFASKRLVDSLKLTRHSLVSRMGPMAMYMASKGSTSWEASVKAKTTTSDAAPPGWKILPREESPRPERSQKRTPVNGGILSFFTRRSTNSSNSETPQRSASPAISISGSVKTESNSPRPSVDIPSTQSASSQIKEIPSATASPTGSLFQSTAPTQHVPQSTLSPTALKSPDFFPEEPAEEEMAVPSKMSRFLGRFTRSSRSSLSQREDSISMSADDLEFLSDVVPIAQEAVKEDVQLRALSSMIGSSPLPTALPAPLAPPPRASQAVSSRLTSLTGVRATPSFDDDLFSIFETPAHPDKPATTSDKQLQPLPSIPFFNSAHDHDHIVNTSLASSTILPSSDSISDFFDSPIFHSPSVPPPIPPPKAPETFFFPIVQSASMSTKATGTSPFASRPATSASSSSSTLIPTLLPPPPPSARTRTPTFQAQTSGAHLPTGRSHTPVARIPTPSQPTIDEDDEFSDFITSPAAKSNHSTTASVLSAFSTPMIPISSSITSNTSRFDDFNDFFTPSPPKQAKQGQARLNSVSLPQSRSSSPGHKSAQSTSPRVSRAEHQRTLSLLETVATRGDKWLSPPSPLPVALPPPSSANKGADLFVSGPSLETQQAQAIPALPTPRRAVSPPAHVQKAGPSAWIFPVPPAAANGFPPKAFSPPPPPAPAAPSGYGFNIGATPLPKPSLQSASPAPAPSAQSGGLSASDLAFFEGL